MIAEVDDPEFQGFLRSAFFHATTPGERLLKKLAWSYSHAEFKGHCEKGRLPQEHFTEEEVALLRSALSQGEGLQTWLNAAWMQYLASILASNTSISVQLLDPSQAVG